jgi:hypothetical protein
MIADDADRDRLVKLLRMFSSDHDGEVAAAARAIHKLVEARSLDWDDLIIDVRHPRRYSPPPPGVGAGEADLIHHCLECAECITAWESDFLHSIGASVVQWGRLTPKQRAILDRIVNKLRVQGVWS